MHCDLSQMYIVFAFAATLVLGWETQLICDPYMGSDIIADDCSQAMFQLHDIVLADSDPNEPLRRRLFTRNSEDHQSKLPQSFVHGSCAIGVDLEGMSGLAIASTWDLFYEAAETLVTKCVKSTSSLLYRGFGGYYKIEGFTFVIANPATVDTRGTHLGHPAYQAPSDHDLSLTISIRAELVVMRSRDIVACPIPGRIHGGIASFSPDTFEGILVRQQGPWLLSGGTWVYRPEWYLDQTMLIGNGWVLYRSMRPTSHCFPLYFPESFHGSSIQSPGTQEEILLGGIWLAEGVHWSPCNARKINIMKGLSFQWEWILIRGPEYHPETNVPSHSLPSSAIHEA
ncbi:hypothetical protein MMC17_000711 [Xylographa soralifera]|nr:hypothetical protein [Xylographa soralifera]